MKLKLLLCLALVLSGGLFGCSADRKQPSDLPLHYHNAKYDFTFCLPPSWRGYSVKIGQWDGGHYSSASDKTVITDHGEIIFLRYPQWKTNDLYQDIPIVMFTRNQWDDERTGKMSAYISAGGTIDELWHDRNHVFAISSRYNAADDVKGWQEAPEIIAKNCALHPESRLDPR
jgi:hypothetical protein